MNKYRGEHYFFNNIFLMYNQTKTKEVALMLMMSMLCLISFAQERQVQGIVKDKSGEPMIGVNVLVKGTTNGTITGVDGDFSFRA